MTQQQLLSQLNDIILPEPIGWWPLSHLVWGLIIVILGILAGLIWYILEQRKQNLYRREALELCDDVINNATISYSNKILKLNSLIKQVALTCYGRRSTAKLTGELWVNFLKDNCITISQPNNLLSIINSGYSEVSTLDNVNIFSNYAKQWINGHHK